MRRVFMPPVILRSSCSLRRSRLPAADVPEWENPAVNSLNRLPSHARALPVPRRGVSGLDGPGEVAVVSLAERPVEGRVVADA